MAGMRIRESGPSGIYKAEATPSTFRYQRFCVGLGTSTGADNICEMPLREPEVSISRIVERVGAGLRRHDNEQKWGKMARNKVFASFADAVRDIPDRSVIGFGGFAVVGMPINLYKALAEQGAKGLTCVSNGTRGGSTMPSDAPTMEWLISNDQVTKVICSFTAPTRASQKLIFSEYYEKGLIEAELVPQGTLAERMRAAGAGIPAFYTPAAVGTELAEGRETRVFNGREYLLEEALPLDYAFIRAWQADEAAICLPPLAAQFQPADGDGGADHDRRGRGGYPAARRDRPGRHTPAGHLCASPGKSPAAARRLVANAAGRGGEIRSRAPTITKLPRKTPQQRTERMNKHLIAAAAALLLSLPAYAADNVKIGFVTTLSGPAGIIGKHMKDAADLALSMNGGKIGGKPAEILYADDQFKPDVGRQVTDELLKRDKVDFVTGYIWSNVLLAAYQPAIQSGKILISANAGPHQIAGSQCSPNFFSASSRTIRPRRRWASSCRTRT